MTEKTRVELRLILPDVPNERDSCVARLETLLLQRPGIIRGHFVTEEGVPPSMCLHFDPALITLAEVEKLAKATGPELHSQFGHTMLAIRAIAAEDSALDIEAVLKKVLGVLSASVNLPAQRVSIEFERQKTSVEQLKKTLNRLGFAPHGHDCAHGHHHGKDEATWYGRNKEFVWSITSGVILCVAWIGETWLGIPHFPAVALYLIAFGFGGAELFGHLIRGLRKGRFYFDIDLLMLLAAIGAAALGEWAEGAFLLFLFSLAHAMEHYALGRARNAIKALSDLTPAKAIVLRDGNQIEVPVEDVSIGETVIVLPAQRVSVDGKVRSGHSAVDQAPITGESVPVEKTAGDEVFAGTINGNGALEIMTTRASGDRTLDRVVRMVEEAQAQKAPTQRFTDRFERIFVPCVLLGSVLVIVLPPLVGLLPISTSFYRGMALLVAASPCALALGTPSAVLAGIAQAARKGVLIKGGAYLESLGNLRAMAFDKTGTLTVGKPEVTDVFASNENTEAELLRIAAAVERRSQHPLAAAIVRRAEKDGLEIPETGEVESVTARGVRSTIDGQPVEIGSLRLFENVRIPSEISAEVEKLQQRGRSVMIVRHGTRWLGVIGLADAPRRGIKQSLESLRRLGIPTLVMLSGDNAGVANAIGNEVGINQVRAGLLPSDKVTAIRELLKEHQQVAMIGDGVNDAPALAAATVGIAMGGAGTAAALETADVALMGDDISKLVFAIELSRFARAIISQNLVIALGTIVVLTISTTLGFARIGPAVVFHEGSTLVVILNSLRLLTYRGPSA